jgi:integrase
MPRQAKGPRLHDKPNASGYWQIAVTENGRGRLLSTGTKDRLAAARIAAGVVLGADLPNARGAAPKGRPIADLMTFYDETHAAERVVDRERIFYASIPLRAWFGAMTVHDLDDAILVRYAGSRRTGETGRRPVSDSTIRRELQHLRAVLHYAARNPKRTGVTAADVPHIAMPAKAQPRSLVLTDDEMDRMMDQALLDSPTVLSRAYLFIALARWTAARKEAIERLTWDRVDLAAGVVDYREPGRTVTSKRRVPVPIDSRLRPILERALAERVDEFVLEGGGPIRHYFERAAERAGVPHAQPHALRHTWATAAIRRGVSPAMVALMMGDALDTVMRNYVHLTSADLAGLVD